MEELRGHLEQSLGHHPQPKWYNGLHLAVMLEALVESANNNMMESVPSVWALFLEKQVPAHSLGSIVFVTFGVTRDIYLYRFDCSASDCFLSLSYRKV